MSTLYEKLLEASERHKGSLQELRESYKRSFEECAQYQDIQTKHNGALPLVLQLEKHYDFYYGQYLSKINPVQLYQYNNEFIPHLKDLEGIVSLKDKDSLNPRSQLPAYLASAGVPLLFGLQGILLSAAASYITHCCFITKKIRVFNKLKEEAFFVDAMHIFVERENK